MKRKISTILVLALMVNVVIPLMLEREVHAGFNPISYYQGLEPDHPNYIPSYVPQKSSNGYDFNSDIWTDANYHKIVYGTHSNVSGNGSKPSYSPDYGTYEYRYLGFDEAGNPYSNERFPDDAPHQGNWADANFIFQPWNYGLCFATDYSTSDNCEDVVNSIAESEGWQPLNGFFGYGNVQSMPTLIQTGSFRMWHNKPDGSRWYKTFYIPVLKDKLDTPFEVTTEILANDFTIDEGETSVNVDVKVTAHLKDESLNPGQTENNVPLSLHYNRYDIKEWYLKVEYKGKEILVKISGSNTNQVSKVFTLPISRNMVVDGERVKFDGIGRVVFEGSEGHFYRDVDTKYSTFTVVPTQIPLSPDLSIDAPETANITETYTVEVKPEVPKGESITSLTLERSFNGGAWQNVSLSSNKATENYSTEGTINYRATVNISNGKTAAATASTLIEDNRSATAKANVTIYEKVTYEGHPITVWNENQFYFDSHTYTAKQAAELGVGDSRYEICDDAEYPLDSNMYTTSDWDTETSGDLTFDQEGDYKVVLYADPINGEEDRDSEGVIVKPCPHIEYTLIGSRKDDRKLTLDFSSTKIHPSYPLVSSKTYVDIKDALTGESVRVTNSSAPDSTNIKTLSMSGNKFDFLIKAAQKKALNFTIYVEDTRGHNDTRTFSVDIEPDLLPVAEITASLIQYRDSSGVAKVKVGKAGYSPDGDRLTQNLLRYRIDTDNDGSYSDETLVTLSSSLDEKEATITTDKVGKIRLYYNVKEDLTPSTISSFVTSSDYLSSAKQIIVDVDNLEPHTSLRTIGSVDMDMFTVGESDSISTIQTKVQQMKSSMNAMDRPVDMVSGSGSSEFSSNPYKYSKLQGDTGGQNYQYYNGYTQSNDYYYTYVDDGGARYVRDFKTGSLVEYFSSAANIEIFFAGDWMFINNRNSGSYCLNYYNPDTGQKNIASSSLYATSIDYYDNLNTAVIRYSNSTYKLFDTTTGTLYNTTQAMVDQIDWNLSHREGNYIYYYLSTNSNYYRTYTINTLNITNNVTSQVSTITTPKLDYNSNPIWVTLLENRNLVLFDRTQDNQRLNIILCNYQSKSFEQFAQMNIPSQKTVTTEYDYYGTIYTYTETYNLWNWWIQSPLVEVSDDGSTMYLAYATLYKRSSGSTYAYFVDLIKATRGSSSPLKQEIFMDSGSYSDVDDYFTFLGGGLKLDLYKGRILHTIRRGVWHDSAPLVIRDTNLNVLAEPNIINRHNMSTMALSVLYDEYLRTGNFNKYYYKDGGSYGDWVEDSSGNTLYHTGSSSIYLDYRPNYLVNVNDKWWVYAFKYNYHPTLGDHYLGGGLIDWDTKQVYATDQTLGAGNYFPMMLKDAYIWFVNTRGGFGFNTDARVIEYLPKDISDITIKGAKNKDKIHFIGLDGAVYEYSFPDTFKKEVDVYLSSIAARSIDRKYITFITDNALSLSASDISYIGNKIKAKGLKTIWLGKSGNTATGQGIVNITGGTVKTYTTMDNAFSQLQTYLTSQLPAKEQMYAVNVKKGETVAYDQFYFDLENDGQIPSTVQWYYRHVPSTDGLASFNQTWLSSPVTSFDKNGTYYVSWRVKDNPKPADSNSAFAPYRKWSVREEMMIVVGDAEPPPVEQQIVDPTLELNIGGTLKVNRKVTSGLNVTLGTRTVNLNNTTWQITPVSGGTASDIKVKSINSTSRHLLFKKAGVYRVKATITDSAGNLFSALQDITIIPDEPITAVTVAKPTEQTGSTLYPFDNYMEKVMDWKDINNWYIRYNSPGSNITWDETKGAWKVTGNVYMYLKNELAPAINPDNSYVVEVTAMTENNQNYRLYWGGERLNENRGHLGGFGGTYDYSATNGWVRPPEGEWTTYSIAKSGTSSDYSGWGIDGCTYFAVGGLVNYGDSTSAQTMYIKDIKFYYKNQPDFDIEVYRDQEGDAKVTVKTEAASPDDYIEYIKYWAIYDSDNDGNFNDETPVEMVDNENKIMFEFEALNGVGNYKILAAVKEGFSEETLPEFITEADYSKLNIEAEFTVDNKKPMYEVAPEKDVYLIGEEIRYKSNLYGNLLNGDIIKGYFDSESDSMDYLKAIYSQDKTAMVNQDQTSIYHNLAQADLLDSLDRAGRYSIELVAGDDPKSGDSRFDSYKKDSNISFSEIIVHRSPNAEATFTASHPSSNNYNFGSSMYLEGTQLTIQDASEDPDGFAVNSVLSYKVGSAAYTTINSGDTISLSYGDPVTVKMETEDNWGAKDMEFYSITVVNDLNMAPEVVPSPVPASETVTLRLATNQYASSARATILGQDVDLSSVSETATEKVLEAEYSIPAATPDSTYTAIFYASSEGMAEISKPVNFVVSTPINLVPDMPSSIFAGSSCNIAAQTSKYANSVTVNLFRGTDYSEILSLSSTLNGDVKDWLKAYNVPSDIPDGTYVARFTATTPNGNSSIVDVRFDVQSLRIISAELLPQPALAGDELVFTIETEGSADRIEIIVPSYIVDKDDRIGKYTYPLSFNVDGDVNHKTDVLRYITNVNIDKTLTPDDVRLRDPCVFTVTVYKGTNSRQVDLTLDVRRSVLDLIKPGIKKVIR